MRSEIYFCPLPKTIRVTPSSNVPAVPNDRLSARARPQRHTQTGLEPGEGGDIGVGGTPEQSTHGALVHPTHPGGLTCAEIAISQSLGEGTDNALCPDCLDGRIRLELPLRPFLPGSQPLCGGSGPGSVHTEIVRVSNTFPLMPDQGTPIPDPEAVPPIPASTSTSAEQLNSIAEIRPIQPRLGVNASHWDSWWVRGRLESLHSELRGRYDRSGRAGGAR